MMFSCLSLVVISPNLSGFHQLTSAKSFGKSVIKLSHCFKKQIDFSIILSLFVCAQLFSFLGLLAQTRSIFLLGQVLKQFEVFGAIFEGQLFLVILWKFWG
jgi:hypothetical protein